MFALSLFPEWLAVPRSFPLQIAVLLRVVTKYEYFCYVLHSFHPFCSCVILKLFILHLVNVECLCWIAGRITLEWHWRDHGVWNHRQFNRLCNNLVRISTKIAQKLRITGPLWGEFTDDWLGSVSISGNLIISYHHEAWHDDDIKWKHFLRYWPFLRGIHRSPVNSPHKGQWREALMFSLIRARINGWVNNGEAGDLRRHRGHYDVIVTVMNKNDRAWQIKCSRPLSWREVFHQIQIQLWRCRLV